MDTSKFILTAAIVIHFAISLVFFAVLRIAPTSTSTPYAKAPGNSPLGVAGHWLIQDDAPTKMQLITAANGLGPASVMAITSYSVISVIWSRQTRRVQRPPWLVAAMWCQAEPW